MEGLAESVPANLPKMQAEVLDHFVNHVLRPSWKSSQLEGYENLYRKGRPDLLGKREDVCFAVNALDFRKVTDPNVSNCCVEGSIGRKLAKAEKK
ncbi:TPA: hypothetical protein ACH3X3_008209 [Trebouxia sp. C0006]